MGILKSKKQLHIFSMIAGAVLAIAYGYMFLNLPANVTSGKKWLTAITSLLFLGYTFLHAVQYRKEMARSKSN